MPFCQNTNDNVITRPSKHTLVFSPFCSLSLFVLPNHCHKMRQKVLQKQLKSLCSPWLLCLGLQLHYTGWPFGLTKACQRQAKDSPKALKTLFHRILTHTHNKVDLNFTLGLKPALSLLPLTVIFNLSQFQNPKDRQQPFSVQHL